MKRMFIVEAIKNPHFTKTAMPTIFQTYEQPETSKAYL